MYRQMPTPRLEKWGTEDGSDCQDAGEEGEGLCDFFLSGELIKLDYEVMEVAEGAQFVAEDEGTHAHRNGIRVDG